MLDASLSARPVVEYGWRRLLITIAVMCAALLETLDSTIVNVALPTIEGNIGASIDEGVWIITAYIVSNVVAIPLNPFLTTLFGRKRYYAACIIGFTLASFLCSTAHELLPLVLFRLIQGAFGGGLIATSQVVLRETFPPQAVGISSALFAIALILGPALGPIFGGYLTDDVSWQWIFDVNVLPGIFSAAVIIALLRDPLPSRRMRIDWTGLATLAAGLGGLQYVLDNGAGHDWFSDSSVCYAAALGAAGIASFLFWELRIARDPVVDLSIMRMRSVGVGSILAFVFGIVIFAPAVIMPLYSSNILGYTATQSGLLLVARAIPVVLLTPVFATLAQNGADVRYFLVSGFLATAGSQYWLALHMTAQSPFATLATPLAISGIGQSLLLVPLIVGVLSTTPAELNGKVAPMITLFVQLGGTISSAASIAFFDARMGFHQDILRASASLGRLVLVPGIVLNGKSLRQLAGSIFAQATVTAFADTVVILAIIAVIAVPVVFFFPRSRAIEVISE